MSTICDFSEGKISEEEADKRIDDGSYRAMFFRDEFVKKGLQKLPKKEGEKTPEVGWVGLEPTT
jgi:hypothetical protein